jgi:hypothetical protein
MVAGSHLVPGADLERGEGRADPDFGTSGWQRTLQSWDRHHWSKAMRTPSGMSLARREKMTAALMLTLLLGFTVSFWATAVYIFFWLITHL